MVELRVIRSTDEAPRRAPEPLWREVLGRRVRRLRHRRGMTLTATARRAGISAQYLSEVERGRKEPSSEVVAAICGALDCTVLQVIDLAAADLRAHHTPSYLQPVAPTTLLAA